MTTAEHSSAVDEWIRARSRDRLGRRRRAPTLERLVLEPAGLAALFADGVLVEEDVELTPRERAIADGLPRSSAPACVDCWQVEAHCTHHAPHPRTGRTVCHLCHPPAPVDHDDEAASETPANRRPFTFGALERLTPDLAPHERLGVFLGLPVDLQGEAWSELAKRAGWTEGRRGPRSMEELAAEVTLIWDECLKVPLGAAGEPERHTARQVRVSVPLGRDDVLGSIPAVDYVAALTGRVVGSDGKVACPFHAEGEERTPSLHCYGDPDSGWYCFGCGRGGSIVDFGSYLYGIEPRGAGFHEIRRRLAADLLGAVA